MLAGVLELQLMANLASLSTDLKRAERVVQDSTDKMGRSVSTLESAFGRLGSTLSLAVAFDTVRRLTDDYQKLTAQLRIATHSQAEYAQGLADVRRISTVAQSDINATTMLYSRLTNALSQHGATQKQVSNVTEAVSLGLKAYGATATEASSAMLQLSQAFGANRLGGEEFRAVSESMPNMMKVLAASMEVPLSSLKALSAEGKITSEVMMKAWDNPALIEALLKQADLTRTITGEFAVLRNNIKMLVGEFMGASGSTGGITSSIRLMSDAIKTLEENLKTVLLAVTTLSLAYAGQFIVNMIRGISLTIAHTEALRMNALVDLRSAQTAEALALAKYSTATATAASTVSLLRNTIATATVTEVTLAKAVADNAATVAQLSHARAAGILSGHLYIVRQVEAELVVATSALAAATDAHSVATARQIRLQAALIAEDKAATAARAQLTSATAATAAAQNAATASTLGNIAAIGVAMRTAIMANPILAAATAIGLIVVAIANWKDIVDSSKASLKWFQEDFLGGMEFLAAGVGISLGELVQKFSLLANLTVPQLKSGEFKKQWDELGKLAEQSRMDAAARIAGLDKQTVDHEKLAAIEKFAADRADWEKLTNTKAQQRQAEIAALNEQYLKIITGQSLTNAQQLVEAERYNVALANINDKYDKAAAKVQSAAEKKRLEQLQFGIEYENKYWNEVANTTEALNKKAAEMEFENTLIGKTKVEIDALTQARVDGEIVALEMSLQAMIGTNGVRDEEIRAIALQIEALRRLDDARKAKATGEAGVEITKAEIKAAKEVTDAQTAAAKKQWEMIDGFAHDAFDNIFDKGKNVFKELGDAIKKYLLDMLYKMTVQKWLINVGVAGAGVGASGAAMAGTGGAASMFDPTSLLTSAGGMLNWSSIIGGSMGTFGTGIASAMSTGIVSGFANGISALGLGQIGAGLGMMAPGLAIGALALSSLFGSKGTPTASTGNAAMQFDPQGTRTGMQTFYGGSSAATDAMITNMQTSYMKAAMALGIGTVATSFSYGGNTGKNGQSPNFALGGGSFYQSETTSSDAAIQLAASRAVFSALQGSELPGYLAKMFDGLTAGSMTQQDIDNTLVFAGSVKQMRDALLETRAPLEILRANVDAGTAAFSTSAATFRTDFVAAIDAGIDPVVFEQWKALGTAIDQLAQADAQVAAANAEAAVRAAEAVARLAEINLGWQQKIDVLQGTQTQRQVDLANALTGADASTALLINQLFALEDAAAAAAAAQVVAQQRYGLETQLLQVQGNTAELRARELTLLDASNQPLQKQIWALEDKAFADAAAAQAAIESARVNQQAAQEAARASQQIKDAWQSVTDSIFSEVARIRGLLGTTGTAGAESRFAIATAQARAGDQEAAKLLPALSRAVLDLAQANAVTSLDLARVQARTAGSLETTGLTLAGQYGLQLPSYDVGTASVPFDMVAQIHKGERIVPAASNDELVSEIKALRQEVAGLRQSSAETASNTRASESFMRRISPDGNSITVTVAA